MCSVVTACYIILLKISGSKVFKWSFMKVLYTCACNSINPQERSTEAHEKINLLILLLPRYEIGVTQLNMTRHLVFPETIVITDQNSLSQILIIYSWKMLRFKKFSMMALCGYLALYRQQFTRIFERILRAYPVVNSVNSKKTTL